MLSKDFLTFDELDKADLNALLGKAAEIKERLKKGHREKLLDGKSVALIFEKPSTRTRISFEVGLFQLGAHAVVLSGQDMQLGRGETIEDTGRVISRYCDAIVIRTFGQDKLEKLALSATVPVINALSNEYHPCQALADMLTIREKKETLEGLNLTYLGDGNNVCNSLMLAAATAGMNITVGCPSEYAPNKKVVKKAREIARENASSISITDDAMKAAHQADILYTDVWVSMGDEGDAKKRTGALQPYRINEEIMSVASVDAIVMHCLPAHRGQEIDAEILEGPHSVVFDQAENRLHAQKALLVDLLQKGGRR
jgi:ornithine carbamoyltransferase